MNWSGAPLVDSPSPHAAQRSHELESVEHGARLIRGDVGEELAKLQREFDGALTVSARCYGLDNRLQTTSGRSHPC